MPTAAQQPGQQQPHSRRLLLYTLVLVAVWTLLILASFGRYYHERQQEIINIGLGEARAALDRDMLVRAWATRHGGVYVPVTPQTPPNPFLSHVKERDITTPSGKLLTLINPAYMVRQLYEQASEHQLTGRGHITSLNPLRPENKPDPWEERVLKSFESGTQEVSAQQIMDGQLFIRLMRPFVAEQPCLKCHAHQGYKLGDIRGGISVSIPLAPLQEAHHRHIAEEGAIHLLIWLFGLGIVIAGSYRLNLLNRSLETRISEAVNELRRKDETLIQQGRLAAMGEMINNISHQWRQPLNNLGLLLQNLEQAEKTGELTPEELQKDIRDAMGIIMFMSQTIDDFRDFFRRDRHKTRIMVKKQVAASLEFVSATLKSKRIAWTLEGADDLAFEGYPNEFSQVLLNILTNARDALLERCIEEPQIAIRAFAENGRAVVTVTDNAGGIPPEIMPKIFDPYFTTKAPNKGTGIGLYMSKVIIEMHMNGTLRAGNTTQGAEFRIEMPLLPQQYP